MSEALGIWDKHISRTEIIDILNHGDKETNMGFNVAWAYDAAEAAEFIQQEVDKIVRHWHGSPQELDIVLNFVSRNLKK